MSIYLSIWVDLGPILCRPGRSTADLGSIWSRLGRSRADLKSIWGRVGRYRANLGSIWAQCVRLRAGQPARYMFHLSVSLSILFLDNRYYASEKTHLRVHTEMPRSYSLLLGYDTLGYSDIFLVAFPAAILAQSTHIRATCSRLLS